MPPKRKAQHADSGDVETKKLRNRVSQQAFRRRQSEYVKQLERKAKAYKPDNERIIELEEENNSLRESLIQCHTKLESLHTTICTLSDGIARTLDDPDESAKTSPNYNELIESPKKLHPHSYTTSKSKIRKAERDISFEGDEPNTLETSVDTDITLDPKTPDFTCSGLTHEQEPSIVAPLPDIWTHECQMGPASYGDCLAANDAISQQLNIEWAPSNSLFSEHVGALKSILKAKWDGMG
ncbi:hypothetical protein PENARI_c004G07955 [Penicillium arizonense]|uniref:BZIP domain-containing protein n=1 Tax=Penicillium arizonense TaxID=1835702 RepID=A0A1F5LRN2_PENAI|nr:hypothetical protein PENARI_c004G07955 [Penicillium arizonense]OGE55787.1 hypothetical protein PENARI_c004G07955 [Penicillium arizonense]